MAFFGRDDERNFLRQSLQRPKATIFIQGTEGIGKTSLLVEFLARDLPEDVLVLGHIPFFLSNGAEPYFALGERFLAALLDGNDRKRTKSGPKFLKSYFSGLQAAGTQKEYYGLLRERIELLPEFKTVAKNYPSNAANPSELAEEQRLRGFQDALLGLWDAYLKAHPGEKLVVHLEHFDLFRQDTARMLLKAAGTFPERLYLYISYTSTGFKSGRLNRMVLESFDQSDILVIKGLKRDDIAAWIGAEKGVAPSKDQLRAIHQATGGNAERLAMWLESPGFSLTAINESSISQGSGFKEKINEYPAELRRFVRQISVLDFPMSLNEYATVTKFTVKEIVEFMDRLKADRIFREFGPVTWFRSPTVKNMVYDTILPNLIKKYHEGALKIFEESHAVEIKVTHPDFLPWAHNYAWHLHKAMDYRRSLPHNLRVGHRHMALRNWSAAYSCLEMANEAASMIGYDDESKAIRGNMAVVGNILGMHEKVYSIHRELVEHYRQTGDQHNLAIAFYFMGLSTYQLGKLNEARGALKAYLQLTKSSAGSEMYLRVQMLLGEVLLRLRDIEGVEALIGSTRTQAEESGTLHQAMVYHLEADLHLLKGDFPAARAGCERTAALWEKAGARDRQFRSYFNGAVAALLEGDNPGARKLLTRAEDSAVAAGDRLLGAFLNVLKGVGSFFEGDMEMAGRLFKESERFSDQFELTKLKGVTKFFLGLTSKEAGDYGRSRELLDGSLEELSADQFGRYHGLARFHLAAILDAFGETLAAQQQAQAAIEIFRESGDKQALAEAKLLRGTLLAKGQHSAEAKETLREAATLLDEAGVPGKAAIARFGRDLLGHDPAADANWLASLEQSPRGGGPGSHDRVRATALYHEALLRMRQGNVSAAGQCVADGLEIARKRGMRDLVAMLALQQGAIRLNEGNREAAIPLIEEAADIAGILNDAELITEANLLLAEAMLEERKWDNAQEALTQAEKAAKRSGRESRLIRVFIMKGQGELLRADFDQAIAAFDSALELAGTEAETRAEVQFLRGRAYHLKGDLEVAEALLAETETLLADRPGHPLRIQAALQAASAAHHHRRYKAALATLTRLQKSPGLSQEMARVVDLYLQDLGQELGKRLYTRYLREIEAKP